MTGYLGQTISTYQIISATSRAAAVDQKSLSQQSRRFRSSWAACLARKLWHSQGLALHISGGKGKRDRRASQEAARVEDSHLSSSTTDEACRKRPKVESLQGMGAQEAVLSFPSGLLHLIPAFSPSPLQANLLRHSSASLARDNFSPPNGPCRVDQDRTR